MKSILLTFFVCIVTCTTLFSQEDHPYDKFELLNDSLTSSSIKQTLLYYNQQKFNKPFGHKIYHHIPKGKTFWMHFSLPKTEENYYFTIGNSYLPHGKVYSYSNGTLDSLETLHYITNRGYKQVFYRQPTWLLKAKNHKTEYFVEIKDVESKTRLAPQLNTTNDFLKLVEIEYFLTGGTLTYVCLLILIILILFLVEKKYSLLWYGSLVFFMAMAMLANKGIGPQYFWGESEFLITSTKSFSHTMMALSSCFFYANFYPFPKRLFYLKKILTIFGYISAGLGAVYIYKMFYGGLYDWYIVVWAVLKPMVFIVGIIHIILIFHKVIPFYLGFGFLNSIIGIFIFVYNNPTYQDSILKNFFFSELFNLGLILEMTLMLVYIISSNANAKNLASKLENENNTLKRSFNQNLNEQTNNLVNDVHDTFGSYIEALNLQIKNNSDHQLLQTTIKAFRNDYKILLNNNFLPNIDTHNFYEALSEYCKKINQITTVHVMLGFSNPNNTSIPKPLTLEVYKIVCELTTNVIKHAKANTATIKVYIDENTIVLNVKDDGIGMKKEQQKGFGINSVKKRVQFLQGVFQLTSELNKGVSYKISIPIQSTVTEQLYYL
ncbi:sensor histidine kinase [Ochrovirga pacifica]|uniref:sensor histidine kinase n=1 Tax=Ochrovirga pacifica TaxID=1042376 RepID=UPI000255981A|nr:ATP-binding protein [Ochrovirga pacifica]